MASDSAASASLPLRPTSAGSTSSSSSASASASAFNIGPAIGAALGFAAHRVGSPAQSSASGTPHTATGRRPNLPSTRSRGQLARRNSTNLSQAQQQIKAGLLGITASSPIPPASAGTRDAGRDLAQRGNRSRSPSRRREPADYSERPLLGGLYFSDLVVVAFFYALNLVRTLGLAELGDVLLKGLAWSVVALPQEFWRRWSLSAQVESVRSRRSSAQRQGRSTTTAAATARQEPTPAPGSHSLLPSAPINIPRPGSSASSYFDHSEAATPLARASLPLAADLASSSSASSAVTVQTHSFPTRAGDQLSPFPSAAEPPVPMPHASSSYTCFAEQQQDHLNQQQQQQPQQQRQQALLSEQQPVHDQLSPFHHLVILLTRFACSNFPHLVPRVLLAEDTIGPLVRWRTGGGAAGLVREFGAEMAASVRALPARTPETSDRPTNDRPADGASASSYIPAGPSTGVGAPAFRAFWIGTDAHVPAQVRREREKPDPHRPPGTADRPPTTVLYLHGGGFSLGSVAFYAEALIRTLGKICVLEQAASARCIAVEYDLAPAPSARFPAPLLQCLRCYAHLVEVEGIPPESITIAGDSAGANLAMGILLCLNGGEDVVRAACEPGVDIWAERDWSALPMPGQAVLISPWADLRPREAVTFARLRGEPSTAEEAGKQSASSTTSAPVPEAGPGSSEAKLRDAIAEYEWDYVLPETLLHFAQVYAGVMEVPRRVRGPVGWISHVCGVVGAALEKIEEDTARPPKRARGDTEARDADTSTASAASVGAGAGSGAPASSSSWTRQALDALGITPAVGLVARVPRRLTLALKEMLDEPLLGFGPALEQHGSASAAQVRAAGGSGSLVPGSMGAGSGGRVSHGLAPLFPAQERKTEAVHSTADLFVPFSPAHVERATKEAEESGHSASGETLPRNASLATAGMLPQPSTHTRSAEEAARLLDTSPLISPAIADWSSIRLARGMLVTWGERERLASDIEAWIVRLRSGAGGVASSASVRKKEEAEDGVEAARDDAPGQDGDDEAQKTGRGTEEEDGGGSDAETEKGDTSAPSAIADWLQVAVEHGPGGVHAWPFVSMYLAGTEAEREKGLELLARFIAQEPLVPALPMRPHPDHKDSSRFDDGDDTHDPDVDTFDSTPGSFSSAGSMPSDSAPYGQETDESWYGPDAGAGMRTSERIAQHHHNQERHAEFYHQAAAHARSVTRASPSDTATTMTTDSSEGSSSPEGRVTNLGGGADAPGLPSVGLGLELLPPPLQLQMPMPGTTTSMPSGSGRAAAAAAGSRQQQQQQSQVQQMAAAAAAGSRPIYSSVYSGMGYPLATSSSSMAGPASGRASYGQPAYSGYSYQTVSAPCYYEEAQRRERDQRQHQQGAASPARSASQAQRQQLLQAGPSPSSANQRESETDERNTDDAQGEEHNDEEEVQEGYGGLEDIEEVSEGAFSPDAYPSSPSTDNNIINTASHFTQSLAALPVQIPAPIPSQLGFYGFSHYTLPHREPEGLSDITEEGSMLSASVTSGASSPSPARAGAAHGSATTFSFGTGIAAAPTLGAVRAGQVGFMQMAYPMEAGASFEGVAGDAGDDEEGEDEEGEGDAEQDTVGHGLAEEDGDEDQSNVDGEGEQEAGAQDTPDASVPTDPDMAFSPPAAPQPGPSLRTIGQYHPSGSSLSLASDGSSSSRKKPKGDVWW